MEERGSVGLEEGGVAFSRFWARMDLAIQRVEVASGEEGARGKCSRFRINVTNAWCWWNAQTPETGQGMLRALRFAIYVFGISDCWRLWQGGVGSRHIGNSGILGVEGSAL